MDKNLLRKAALQSVALMLSVIMLSYAVRQYNTVTIAASYAQDKTEHIESDKEDNKDYTRDLHAEVPNKAENLQMSEEPRIIFTGVNSGVKNDIIEQLGEQFLIIKKPLGDDFQIRLEDVYINKQLKIIISGYTKESPDQNFIARVYGDEVFLGEPSCVEVENTIPEEDGTYSSAVTKNYGNDPVNSINIKCKADNFGFNVHEITLQLNHVYVHILHEDENYYYIDLRKPKEVYDKILVIDAGHGGKDPGAISKDGENYEKDINLKIMYELKELLDKDNVKVYYTRTMDETIYLRPRVTLANEVECDFFISIHCNSNEYTGPNGTEILYYNHENDNIKTKDLAKILSDELAKTVSLKNSGVMEMKDDDIFILANAKVPAVIIETGYISNINDLNYLQSKTGQQDIAKGIYNGIWRAYDELIHQ
ncbi:MAG TPA: N-acetylmuramoyl-L-alanine amidase [Mobilitalea sp.]|nr:N-acetylmuramoyl-L-alanine amidase [Mobilitalea sp.]